MATTVDVSLPRPGLTDELRAELAAHGLAAEPAGEEALRVRFADEREQLVAAVLLAIEGWLAARELPLVVERADGACVVRPPGD